VSSSQNSSGSSSQNSSGSSSNPPQDGDPDFIGPPSSLKVPGSVQPLSHSGWNPNAPSGIIRAFETGEPITADDLEKEFLEKSKQSSANSASSAAEPAKQAAEPAKQWPPTIPQPAVMPVAKRKDKSSKSPEVIVVASRATPVTRTRKA